MLLRVSIPVEAGNAVAKAGTLGSTVERILADLKPESAYFMVDDGGQRSGYVVFDSRTVPRFLRSPSRGFWRLMPEFLSSRS
jgi:hypothetical protein